MSIQNKMAEARAARPHPAPPLPRLDREMASAGCAGLGPGGLRPCHRTPLAAPQRPPGPPQRPQDPHRDPRVPQRCQEPARTIPQGWRPWPP